MRLIFRVCSPVFSCVLCVHAWAWTAHKNESIANATRVVDLEDVDPELRGFSEALRVGRYAYLTPLAERPHSYTSKVIRINLGTVDIGHMLDYLDDNNMKVREIVDVLNLKLIDESLKGFSGMFQSKCHISYRSLYLPCYHHHVVLTSSFFMSDLYSWEIPVISPFPQC